VLGAVPGLPGFALKRVLVLGGSRGILRGRLIVVEGDLPLLFGLFAAPERFGNQRVD